MERGNNYDDEFSVLSMDSLLDRYSSVVVVVLVDFESFLPFLNAVF